MLENIELVARWLPKLEKKLESLVEGAHADFRVFLSALPQKVVPVPILQASIKLTNEPPVGWAPLEPASPHPAPRTGQQSR